MDTLVVLVQMLLLNGIIEYCYNFGTITRVEDAEYQYEVRFGGISGAIDDSTLRYCYSIGGVEGAISEPGLIVGATNIWRGGVCDGCFAVNFSNYGVCTSSYTGTSRVITKGTTNPDDNELTQWTQEQININLRESGETNEIFVKDTNNKNRGYPLLKWQVEHGIY